MYDPPKSMNEYPVICEVALLSRRREYGICWQESRVVMQNLKQIGSIPDTIEKPILLFGSGDVLKYGDIE
ncbi:MAG: hypothetical protein M3O68_02575 [Thermoproteota archaeon]|jgi:hypothetical protein|nr:hypothetical protein [Thermoproteota archaeon]